MSGYGQFCPIAKASEILSERWTLLVVRELSAGSNTFNDLRRGLPRISPSLLSTRLKLLEKAGIVIRSKSNNGVQYTLTEAGHELKPILVAVGMWGQRWVRSDLGKDDLDPSLLIWDIHRSMNADYFGTKRVVLLFEFHDYTSRFRFWWLVINDGDVDVCMKDPGFEVDLYVITDVRTLTGIWMGDLSLEKTIITKQLKMIGPSRFVEDIREWLGVNYFADKTEIKEQQQF